jgi:hypothetical protein
MLLVDIIRKSEFGGDDILLSEEWRFFASLRMTEEGVILRERSDRRIYVDGSPTSARGKLARI